MRIDNRTKWDTESLRYITGQCLQMLDYKSEDLRVVFKLPNRHFHPEPSYWSAYRGARKVWDGAKQYRELVKVYMMDVFISNPAEDLDLAGADHTDRVVDLARSICEALIYAHDGAPNIRDRPIPWLADWYEVRRSEKGRAAGCAPSPLVPAKTKLLDPGAERNGRHAHAIEMLADAERRLEGVRTARRQMMASFDTKEKRAETIRRKWAAKVRGHEQFEKRGGIEKKGGE